MKTHFRHVEDLVLYDGFIGGLTACMALSPTTIVDTVTEKVDGSPAFLIEKNEGTFSIALKSNSHKMFSIEEIELSHYSKELKEKLKNIFTYTRHIEFFGKIYGDYLGSNGNFHANLIVYPNPNGAYIGLCLHTQILPTDQVVMPIVRNNNPNLYLKPTTIKTSINDHKLDPITWKAWNNLDTGFLAAFTKAGAGKIFEQIYNNKIRNQNIKTNSEELEYIYEIKASKLKTDIGKNKVYSELKVMLDFLNSPHMVDVNDFRNRIVDKKLDIINKLNEQHNTYHVIKTDGEKLSVEPEGYVVRVGGEPIKLVDREKFSRQNFSAEFVKGWN